MRSLNKAIIRERHLIPTIDDVVSDFNGCKVFSKIDLNQGYHQFLQFTGQSSVFTCSCMAKVITDHKPLVSLFNNPSSKPSARIERWLLELQQFRFTVEYRPSASNPGDYASRHPVGDPESHSDDVECEEHISFVARNAVPKAVTLSEIESATAKDPMLQAAMSVVKSGCWHKAPPDVSLSELSRYEQVKEQLTCTDTFLLKSDCLVVRATLQERIVDIAHEGHLGLVKMKALL